MLVDRAEGLLDRSGHSPSTTSLEKVAQTLEAVAVDEETRAAFAAGRLTREQRASGLSLLAGEGMAAPAPAKRSAAKERAGSRKALKAAKGALEQKRRAVAEAERELAAARKEAKRSQRRLERATKALERAQADSAAASERVAEAEQET